MKAGKGKRPGWPRSAVKSFGRRGDLEFADDGMFIWARIAKDETGKAGKFWLPWPVEIPTWEAVAREATRLLTKHHKAGGGLENEIMLAAAKEAWLALKAMGAAYKTGIPHVLADAAWCAGWKACVLYLRERLLTEVRKRRNSRESLQGRTRSAAEEAAWNAVAAAEGQGERHGKTLHGLYGKAGGTLGERSFLTLLARRRKSFSTLRR